MSEKKSWKDLSDGQRLGIIVAGSIELALTATALTDLARRPRERVRGPKALWALVSFIQPFGPIAYLFCGRRKAEAIQA